MAKRLRGSLWLAGKAKYGRTPWRGSYNVKKGNRHFILTNEKTGVTRAYESPQAAMADGWSKE